MIFPILSGNVEVLYAKGLPNICKKIMRMNDADMTANGKAMKERIKNLSEWRENSITCGALKAHSFLKDVHTYIEKNPDCKNEIEINMLQHMIAKDKGIKAGRDLHLKIATKMMLLNVRQKSGSAFRFLSANTNSVSERSIQQTAAKMDTGNNSKSIIDKDPDSAVGEVVNYVTSLYDKRGITI